MYIDDNLVDSLSTDNHAFQARECTSGKLDATAGHNGRLHKQGPGSTRDEMREIAKIIDQLLGLADVQDPDYLLTGEHFVASIPASLDEDVAAEQRHQADLRTFAGILAQAPLKKQDMRQIADAQVRNEFFFLPRETMGHHPVLITGRGQDIGWPRLNDRCHLLRRTRDGLIELVHVIIPR